MSKKQGLYANIHAKRKRIAAGSGEKMRKAGAKGAPTAANFKRAAKTAKKKMISAVRSSLWDAGYQLMERGVGIRDQQ